MARNNVLTNDIFNGDVLNDHAHIWDVLTMDVGRFGWWDVLTHRDVLTNNTGTF